MSSLTAQQWKSFDYMVAVGWPYRDIAKELRVSLTKLTKALAKRNKERSMYASVSGVKTELMALDFTGEEADKAIGHYGDLFEDGLSDKDTAAAICDAHRKDLEA